MKVLSVFPGEPAILIDADPSHLMKLFDWPSLAHPFEDPIGILHDDDGIANGRMPNRTINGSIIPGPFFVLQEGEEDFVELSDNLAQKYLQLFSEPENFPHGHWKVTTGTSEFPHTTIISLKSHWIPDEEDEE